MPSTLPGFLFVAGLALVVLAMMAGGIKIKDLELPGLSQRSKKTVLFIGIACVLASSVIYSLYGLKLIDELPALILIVE